jgi:hypothetical protein
MDIPLPPSPPRPASGGGDVEYSPSHVTSPLTEDEDAADNVANFLAASAKHSTPPERTPGSPKPKLLGGKRASKLLVPILRMTI